MGYTKTTFDHTADGTEVYRYTLTNEQGVSASFTNFGAIWLTMSVPDKNGQFDDVILGYDSVDSIQTQPGHPGEPVGRNANRIGGAKFTLNGVTYELAKNSAEVNNLHSGPDLYHSRLWESWAYETAEGSRLDFFLNSPDGDQGYPGNAKIRISYTLTEDSCLKIDYSMVADADTVANFTNHCYFNLAGHNSGPVMDQQVWLAADTYTPADAVSIPTGEILPVAGTPMDFTKMKPIGQDIEVDFEALILGHGYDHNWVLNHEAGVLGIAGKAKDPASGRVMEAYTDLPGMQFYTANFLKDERPGKGGAHYDRRHAFCFETQYYPDACHKPNFPSPILKAGDTYKTTTIYKFYAE